MNTEQGLEAQAQGRIIGTGLIQIVTTFASLQGQSSTEDGHFTIGRGVHWLLNTPQYNECRTPQANALRCWPGSLAPLGSEALLVRLPPVGFNVLRQFASGCRRRPAAACDALHAEPGDEIVDLARRHALGGDGDL